jgi:hypothetical protein
MICALTKSVPPAFNKVKFVEPLEGVAHFNPVASELSATNLIQEQSQRIVLGE